MNNKLICPFCGDNLRLHEDCIWGLFACSHPTCEKSANMRGTKELWQALIQAKQDLEIATQALKDITKEHSAFADWVFKAVTMKSIAEKALEQIEHKEK